MNRLSLSMCSATVIALLACAPLHATAQIHSTPPPLIHNIVLVHGAWADGTSWSKVVPLLEAEGFHVTAVHLPFTTLAEDAAAVARVLKLQDGPVLLVGHSYGGAVITEAGDDPKVTRLVYVDAFAPDLGQSVSDLVHQDAGPSGGKEIRPDASGFLTLTAQGVMQDFAQDLTVSEQHLITATQGQVSGPDELGAKLTRVAWKQKPTFYVVADDDRMIGPALENRFATQMHATQIHIASGHLVMLSHPVQVAEFIAAAANTAK